MSTTSECREFRAHLLRPDKCRTCFMERDKHPAAAAAGDASGSTTTQTSHSDSTHPQVTRPAAAAGAASPTTGGECAECARRQLDLDRLGRELAQWRAQCGRAEEEARRAREDTRALQNEMDEMHDNFKEEESEQFERVKQELDACLKNCKILQIKLNKSERQYGQLEQVKQLLERQLEEQAASEASENRSLGVGAQARGQTASEDDCGLQLLSSPQGATGLESTNTTQLGHFVSVSAREYDQLLRELNDISERERDLQEQAKYSQEEAQLKGERLQAVEAENEILLGRIQKLTLANSGLRSRMMAGGGVAGAGSGSQEGGGGVASGQTESQTRELCEQNEQMKLALELAQAEGQRLRGRVAELQQELEARERSLKSLQVELEQAKRGTGSTDSPGATSGHSSTNAAVELECRQLRARVAHAERQCRQLRSQLESGAQSHQQQQQRGQLLTLHRTHSQEGATSGAGVEQQAEQQAPSEALARQCRALEERNGQLELKVQRLIELSSHNLDAQTNMETDLFDKLKRQLDASESELAKAKSRLVELDIECGRAQRQHKRLLSSLETCGSAGGELAHLRRNRLPPSDAARDALSRAELRQALRDLELDIEDLMGVVRAKECLLRELSSGPGADYDGKSQQLSDLSLTATTVGGGGQDSTSPQSLMLGEQLKSLRRQMDQEQLLSANLKLDVAHLERECGELRTRNQLLERERVAMEAELDKMRALLGEQRAELEESERERAGATAKSRDLVEILDKLKMELAQARQQQQQQQLASGNASPEVRTGSGNQQNTELLVMARDLSELKVKNGFLMRQLELARDDAATQLEDLRTGLEAQQRHAVELAQLELRERHLQEGQKLRDELQEAKQKLAGQARQGARQEEELAQERDRVRALERDWRRDKSQWQQAREQLEGQLAIEKRSAEFRLKEAEAAIRDKERSLTSVQDRAVQLERDLKRLQSRHHLLEEDCESKCKQAARELEACTKSLHDLQRTRQEREEQLYDSTKRLQGEKATLKETLETIKRSYDEKLVEARQLRELLQARQEQSYKDRTQQQERVETLTRRLNEASDAEAQEKLLRQRLEIQERQLESVRRELAQVKEERARLRARCEELEMRELITKTSSISGAPPSHSFLKPFGSKSQLLGRTTTSSAATSHQQQQVAPAAAATSEQQQQPLAERLSGKINDQRHLIDMLRQELSERQLELKQLQLLQSTERSKWQAHAELLQSRLNECEEKLANETAMVARHGASPLMEQLVGPRLEAAWAQERRTAQELIRQQQRQIELLARDLKKTSAGHELLRLHSKQLEAQTGKLSRKLIEYQQQLNFTRATQPSAPAAAQEGERLLRLEYEQLRARHTKLERDTRPLIEIVSKIVGSLDAPEQQQQVVGGSGGAGNSQAQTVAARSPDSTERPLRAGSQVSMRASSTRTSRTAAADSDGDSESELSLAAMATSVNTAKPAHLAHHQSQTRLARLLAGGKQAAESPQAAGGVSLRAPTARPASGAAKSVKRVRVKCSTLGITTGEKKLLKQQLRALSEALARPQDAGLQLADDTPTRSTSVTPTTTTPTTTLESTRRPLAEPHHHHHHSDSQQFQQQQQQQTSRAVHWQRDSDLESERSWSLEPSTGGPRSPAPASDTYRRFPQATPTLGGGGGGNGRSSLTDYESESSLASEYSLGLVGSRRLTPASSSSAGGANGGAESDSGLSAGRKKGGGGFKGRLTSTLRNLSRSITGGLGGSDTEDLSGGSVFLRRSTPRHGSASAGGVSPAPDESRPQAGKRARSVLKECRV